MKTEKTHALMTWLRPGVLVLLVAAAICLWWTEGREAPDETLLPTPTPATVQKDQRSERETAYDRDVAALQALLESGAADESTQEMAAQQLTELIEEHQNEIGLENALQEAGYADAVVLVQNGAVTVMIRQERLSEENSAQILALCVAHTDAGAENIRVMGLTPAF